MKKNVVITSGLYPSQGMISLIKYISTALIYNKEFKKKYNLKIFIFNENIILKLKKIIFNFYLIIINIFIYEKKRVHGFSPSAKNFISENNEYKKYFHLFHDEKEYYRFNIDLILPLQVKIRSKVLSAGYIYDLQHIDLPKLFDKREKKNRDSQFKDILELNNYVIVNSHFVKKGLVLNYRIKNKKIIQLPFLPYNFDKSFFLNKNIKDKYQINHDYFIICNSFWKHKNHEVAFEAFKNFLKVNPNYQLICTGNITDTRFPKYFDSLIGKFKNLIKDDKLRILGVIPRSDQLSLIKSSVAVIQPTLYEGGPGGFASYEALSYGKKLLLSKIKINTEVISKNVYFFNPKSSKILCNLLLKISKTKKNNFSNKKIKEMSVNNQKKLGNYLLKTIDRILK